MSTTPTATDKAPRKQCRLAEILQYQCEADQATGGQMHCLPIPRIFRMYTSQSSLSPSIHPARADFTRVSCQDRPAVELTRFIDVDLETGAVHIPTQSRLASTIVHDPHISIYAHASITVKCFLRANRGET